MIPVVDSGDVINLQKKNGEMIPVVDSDKHLGNYISTNISDRHTIDNIYDLYQRSTVACPGIPNGGPENLKVFLVFFSRGGPAQKIVQKMIFPTKKVAKDRRNSLKFAVTTFFFYLLVNF